MPATQPENNPLFENFMQACINNPSFLESMKQMYSNSSQQRPNPVDSNRNVSPIQANPYNHSIPSQSFSRQEEYRGNYLEEDELESTSQKEFKK
jgi:hypothetical protein